MNHTKENGKCPCYSGKLFAHCCKPVIENHSNAKTAEQLMRSRYTAFTLANNQYLLDSWAQETRPKDIHAEDDAIQWITLEVEKCEKGNSDNEDGFVTFTARFLSSGNLCRLHEKSSFIKDGGLWYYLDGETESDTERVGRNTPCPCGSGKKYKRCCC